jgi:hypothetical protein
MITYGGTMNFSRKCQSIDPTMGQYLLDSPMIAIQMGVDDVVSGVQWLQSLGMMALDFQKLFNIFFSKGKKIELKGIQRKPYKVISSNSMKKFLNKGHHGVIVQLCSLDGQTSRSSILMDLQKVMKNHSKVFGEMSKRSSTCLI